MKIVAGLGNPGPQYEATRHNVGWWVVERIARDWGFGSFRREGAALVSGGVRAEVEVLLIEPQSYMNRSGPALRPWIVREGFDPAEDLLVVVDDAALEVGRVRFRPGGSDGGHNGLASVGAVVGSGDFPRLRVGVGRPPAGESLVDWVLGRMEPGDEETVLDLLPPIRDGVEFWLEEGIAAAMNRFNSIRGR